MEWMKKNIRDKVVLIGGAEGACLTEVEIALRALDIDFEAESSLIYQP